MEHKKHLIAFIKLIFFGILICLTSIFVTTFTSTQKAYAADIPVTIVWQDTSPRTVNGERDQYWNWIRPSNKTVTLMRGNTQVSEANLNSENTYTFTNISSTSNLSVKFSYPEPNYEYWEQYKRINKAYTYNYDTTVTGNATRGFTITNTLVSNIKGNITVKGEIDKPETVTVNLLKNGVVIDSQVVNKNNDYAFDFGKHTVYSDNGMILYSTSVEKVQDYFSEPNGYDIVLTPETKITLTKDLIGNSEEEEFGVYIVPVHYQSTGLIPKSERRYPKLVGGLLLSVAQSILDNAKEYDKTSGKTPIYPLLTQLFNEKWITEKMSSPVPVTATDVTAEEMKHWFLLSLFIYGENHLNDNFITTKERGLNLPNYQDPYEDTRRFLERYSLHNLRAFEAFSNEAVYNEIIPVNYSSFDEYVDEEIIDHLFFYTTIKAGETKTVNIPAENLMSLMIFETDYEDTEEFEPIYWNKINGTGSSNYGYGDVSYQEYFSNGFASDVAKNEFEYDLLNTSKNLQYYDLSVYKTTTNDKEETFDFLISANLPTTNKTTIDLSEYADVTFDHEDDFGKWYAFSLNTNERIQFNNLPEGTQYKVIEKDKEGWQLLHSIDTDGTLQHNTIALFSNRPIKLEPNTPVSINVTKNTVDNETGTFDFIIKSRKKDDGLPTSCFVAGTKIAMNNGTSKNIEDIVVGDIVFGNDKVDKLIVGESATKTITLANGETITSSPDHYFLCKGEYHGGLEQPKKMSELVVGDILYTEDLEEISVVLIEENLEVVPVYCIELEGQSYLLVGNSNIIAASYAEGVNPKSGGFGIDDFPVILIDGYYYYDYSQVEGCQATDIPGEYKFSLSEGETKTLPGLSSFDYEIREVEKQDWNLVNSVNDTGLLEGDVNVEFTNELLSTHNITIEKETTGNKYGVFDFVAKIWKEKDIPAQDISINLKAYKMPNTVPGSGDSPQTFSKTYELDNSGRSINLSYDNDTKNVTIPTGVYTYAVDGTAGSNTELNEFIVWLANVNNSISPIDITINNTTEQISCKADNSIEESYTLQEQNIESPMQDGYQYYVEPVSFNISVPATKETVGYNMSTPLPQGLSGANGVYTFSLATNGKIVLKNIPQGYQYEIVEQPKDNWNLVSVDNDTWKNKVISTVNDEDKTHTFLNKPNYSLVIKKETDTATNDEFNFEAIFSEPISNPKFTLLSDSVLRFEGADSFGYSYIYNEGQDDETYMMFVDGMDTIALKRPYKDEVLLNVNELDSYYAEHNFETNLGGIVSLEYEGYRYTVVYRERDEYSLYNSSGSYFEIKPLSFKYSFNLKKDESVKVDNLAYGTEYEIYEVDNDGNKVNVYQDINKKWKLYSATNTTGTITNNTDSIFKNNLNRYNLEINKKTINNVNGEFNFKIRFWEERQQSPTDGQAYFVVSADGLTGTFFRSTESYENESVGTFRDIYGNSYQGTVYNEIESQDGWQVPDAHVNKITSIGVADNQVITPKNCSYMFVNCTSLSELEISSFDTSSVTEMTGMFANCQALTSLDLSSFNVSNVTIMRSMFNRCSSLSLIYASDWYDSSRSVISDDMFEKCTSLPGFSTNQRTWEKARIQPDGYFTLKQKNNTNYSDHSSSQQNSSQTNSSTIEVPYILESRQRPYGIELTPTENEGEYTFNLIANSEIIFQGLPCGIHYEIEELSQDGWKLISSDNSSGLIEQDTIATFTNEKLVNLEVQKTITGGSITDTGKDFEFYLYVYEPATIQDFVYVAKDLYEIPVGAERIDTGVYKFNLSHTELINFEIPYRYQYKIVEKPLEGWYLNSVNGTQDFVFDSTEPDNGYVVGINTITSDESYVFNNAKEVSFPFTGTDSRIYNIVGLMIMILGACLYLRRVFCRY